MRIAYLDCFSGISGDMFLGALLNAGLDENALRAELARLPVDGWDLEVAPVVRRGIAATQVTVRPINQPPNLARGKPTSKQANQQTSQPANHSHDHEHAHTHTAHDHHETHSHDHGRGYLELLALIEASSLPSTDKERAGMVFRRIAVAEAKIHGTTPEQVHFHEVGGIDSLVDIVGAVVGLRLMGIEELHASRLPLSHGFIQCAHGRFPLPAPATLEILKDAPWYDTSIEGELITPTGAALLAALCRSFGDPPPFVLESIGYGSGQAEFAHPNVLRMMVGRREPGFHDLRRENLRLIETNIDDMNPEFYDHVFERAFALGALDVYVTPVQMKKNRPGIRLSALAPADRANALVDLLLQETTTLGARVSEVTRYSLDREVREVATPFGSVRVKLGKRGPRVLRVVPEYEDCKRLAGQAQVPLQRVYAAAQDAAAPWLADPQKESDGP